jgi:hypothetical protein
MIKLQVEDVCHVNSELDIKLKKAKDFFIEPHNSIGSEELNFSGNFFWFSDCDKYYYHLLRDYIAQYELIKKLIPDLVPVIVCTCRIDSNSSQSCVIKNPTYPPHNFINKSYFDIALKIDGKKYKKLTFENIFYIYAYGDLVPYFRENNFNKILFSPDMKTWIEESYGDILRDKYKNYIEPIKFGKKIYVTRLNESKKIWEISDAWDRYFATKELPSDEKIKNEVLKIENTLPEGLLVFNTQKSRAFSVDDEILLENYFSSKGYRVVSPGDYSVEDQIALFSSSGHIVGAGGSGMTNLFFCHPETKITMLSAGLLFGFGGLNVVAKTNNRKIEVFPRNMDFLGTKDPTNVKYSAESLIREIEESGIEL